MGVQNTAARQMRYWCQAGPGKSQGGPYSVGYSQPDRWFAYERSNDAGWLTQNANMDCSAGVAGAINFGLHLEAGVPWGDSKMLPRSTWTGSIRSELTSRGWTDVHWDDSSLYPDGGLQDGDVILSEGASGGVGHVAMVCSDGLAEAWIAEDGSIDGYVGDSTGSETRVIGYREHVYTRQGRWTHCLRYSSGSGGSTSSSSSSSSATPDYQLSEIQAATLRAADTVGCPWYAALAMLWCETGERGANIFGHDAGGAMYGAGEVTEAKFRDFYNLIRNGATSNGVGPGQITYPGYFFNDPDRAWWQPEKSMEVACTIIRDHINAQGDSYEALKRVGSLYNSGSPYGTYDTYGQRFSDRCRSWYNYGRPAGAGGEEDWMSEGVDLLKQINARLIEVSDQTGAGIEGRRFDGPLVGWLKEISYSTKRIESKLDAIESKLEEKK